MALGLAQVLEGLTGEQITSSNEKNRMIPVQHGDHNYFLAKLGTISWPSWGKVHIGSHGKLAMPGYTSTYAQHICTVKGILRKKYLAR